MRTKHLELLRFCFIFSLLTILSMPIFSLDKTGYKVISGTVYDLSTKKAISNVLISAKNTNISTITNEDGFFSLKIDDSNNINEIEISHLGYNNTVVNIEDNKQDKLEIVLAPDVKTLSSVFVYARDANNIVKEAIQNIENNNYDRNSLLKGFYRETAQKRGSYIIISEAVINIYKSSIPYNIDNDAIQVLKGRTLMSPKISDTIVVKAQGGPNIAKYLDIVKNKNIMLDLETLHFYSFKLEGYTTINNENHYIIDFKPIVIVPYALYYGKLYINTDNLTIARAELNLDVSNKSKATQMVLVKKPAKMKFQVNSLTSVITYKQYNNKSYLNYINNEVKFKCNWKKLFYIFAPTYTITSEVVITDKTNENAKPIANKDIFGVKHTLPDKIENFYDPDYWKSYNIIEPTESLESAVNKLKKHHD